MMEYTPRPERDEDLRMLALDDEHFDAEVIARVIKSKRYPSRLLDFLATHDRRKFRLVVEAIEGKRTRQQHLSDEGVKIMRAYGYAEWACGRKSFVGTYINIDLSKPAPTPFEIKMEYARLYIGTQPPRDQARQRAWLRQLQKRNLIPRDETIQRTLDRCEVEFRLEKPRHG
jgi:hypothetical protein